jgi:hypothetical protein
MKIKITILTLVLASLIVAPAIKSAGIFQGDQKLIEPGAFHGDEVTARSGEKWLGLYITDEDSMLLTYRLTVDVVQDSLVDEDGQKTGKEVSVDLPLEPLFLIKGKGILKEGPVTTVFDDASSSSILAESSTIALNLAGTSYALKVAGSEDTTKCPDQSLPRNARLVLVNGESRQVLYSLQECGSDPTWALVWAGDLDRDGKLDLYVSVTQHYNVTERKLFLSSPAGEGQLVKEVAEFVTSGC